MYKIYCSDNALVIAREGIVKLEPEDEVLYLSGDRSIIERTKLLQKLQNTKRTVLIADDPESVMNKILGQFTIVEAAGGLITNPAGEFLMIFRRGRWDLPKGKIEAGEENGQCAVREVEEECGVCGVTLKDYITTTYHVYEMSGEWMLKPTYWFAMEYEGDEALVPQTEEDILSAEWIPADRLERYLSLSYPTIRDVFESFSGSYRKNIEYFPSGVCAQKMDISLDGEIITNIKVTGGCTGNSQGVAALAKGQSADFVIGKLEGINCSGKNTSCPDQLAQALKQNLRKK